VVIGVKRGESSSLELSICSDMMTVVEIAKDVHAAVTRLFTKSSLRWFCFPDVDLR